ncbi:hypothetical protein PG993_002527 [Apiospora rasikravindrae]|uniref:Uncharacterized protein n=1 Tax=Apiospora rasikravindrae TaxID=990691 RepID=A0ABR1TXB4_9PEZI
MPVGLKGPVGGGGYWEGTTSQGSAGAAAGAVVGKGSAEAAAEAAAGKGSAEQVAAEQVVAEQVAAEQVAAEQVVAEQAAAEQVATEQVAAGGGGGCGGCWPIPKLMFNQERKGKTHPVDAQSPHLGYPPSDAGGIWPWPYFASLDLQVTLQQFHFQVAIVIEGQLAS